MAEVKTVNVVATADLGQRVDLEELGKFKGILYDRDVYGGRVAYVKFGVMKGKVSVFFSGKMISVGTRSEEEAFRDLGCVKDFLVEKVFVRDVKLEPKVRNVVFMADLRRPIDLERLSVQQKLIYEPEQFPGAILRLHDPVKATILLFASGKAVISGLKARNQISTILNDILE